LIRSRFIDSVLEWHSFLSKQSCISAEYRADDRFSLSYNPPSEGIESLVNAFRSLGRLGESTVSRITIHTNHSSPWVVAFTQWCLGASPSIYAKDGTPILEQTNLSVDLIVGSKDGTRDGHHFSVTVHHNIGNPEELISVCNDLGRRWNGMTTIENYAKWMLEVSGMDQGPAFRALQQCLPYAAKRYLEWNTFTTRLHHIRSYTRAQMDDDVQVSNFLTMPFESDRRVGEVLFRMLNAHGDVPSARAENELPDLEHGDYIYDLPLVRRHLNTLIADCECTTCQRASSYKDRVHLDREDYYCLMEAFIRFATSFLGDAISLSLFHNSEDLLIVVNQSKDDEAFKAHYARLLPVFGISPNLWGNNEIKDLLATALALVGHRNEEERRFSSWAMSCSKGQVVYPTMFQSPQIKQRGFLDLSWYSGTLYYQGETYQYVHGDETYTKRVGNMDPSKDDWPKEIIEPLNLYDDMKLRWRITTEDSALSLGAYLEGSGSERSRSPVHALTSLTYSFVIEQCSHDRDSRANRVDPIWTYSSPESPGSAILRGMKSIVPVDGSHELRFFSLARVQVGDFPVVVSINACLACSLKLCKEVKSSILIL
jgi:hypothetical protein